ncbi:DUF222 domain-containing protein [Actinoplanes sp. DH11]|uniref:DUF222 domain-containing protein n=1 Tax=Actinoplanes sp. DH11 TaxID=2857011 RepID=UPI001E2BAC32|nr:DUF222 domain-containing protein [Actinoplanes sp. DH11]
MNESATQLSHAAAACAVAPMWALADGELLEFLDAVHAAEQLVRIATAHAIREIEGRAIPARQQAPTAAAWLRGRLRISSGAAVGLLRQARLLDTDASLDAAVAEGRVNSEQLDVIARVLKTLPKTVDEPTRTAATETLIRWSTELDPAQLIRAGSRIMQHVAPEVADATEEAALRRAEREAHEQRFLTLSPIGDGRIRVKGILDAQAAAIVTAALDPLCHPGADLVHPGRQAVHPGRQGSAVRLDASGRTAVAPDALGAAAVDLKPPRQPVPGLGVLVPAVAGWDPSAGAAAST